MENEGTKMERPVEEGPAPVLSVLDIVDAIRAMLVTPASSLPEVPIQFRPLSAEEKWPLLKPADDQKAEILEALDEAAVRGPLISVELGRFAPDPEWARHLAERLRDVRAGKVRIRALGELYEEQDEVASNDALTFLLALRKEVDHVAEHEPAVRDRYPALMALADQRREAILNGRARKARERAEKAAAEGSKLPPK